MAKDFKASQLRTTQIIASGSLVNKPSLIIASASSPGVNFDGGAISNSTLLGAVGKDVFLFVSGATSSKNSLTVQGVTVFGGDIVISGTAYNSAGNAYGNVAGSDTQVQFNDAGQFGADAGLTYNKVTDTLSVGSLYITGTTATTWVSGALNVSGNMKIGDASSDILQVTSTTWLDNSLNVSGSMIVAGNLTIKGTTTSVSSSNLTIADPVVYIASGSVGTGTKSAIAFASGSQTANQSLIFGSLGSGNILAAAKQDVQSGSLAQSSLSFADLVPVQASSFQVGSTGNNYISSSQNNSLELQAQKVVLVLSGGGASSPDSRYFADTNFYVSGSVGSRATSTRGTSVFGGDALISGSGYVVSNLQVTGNLQLYSDVILGTAGGTGPQITRAGDTSKIGFSNDGVIALNASNTPGAGTVKIQKNSVDYLVLSSTTSDSAANIATFKLGTDPGMFGFTSLTGKNLSTAGTDVFFYVSGTAGSKDTTTRGAAVFGGDVVISGTLHGGSPLKVSGSMALSGSLRLQTQASAPPVGSNESVLYVLDNAGTKTLYWKNSDGTQQQVGTGGSSVITGAFNEVNSAGTVSLVTTASLSIAGAKGFSYGVNSVGTDVFFFVSGSVGGKGGPAPRASVFGGDVLTSGTLYTSVSGRPSAIFRNLGADAVLQLSGAYSVGGGPTKALIQTETTNQNTSFVLRDFAGSKVEFLRDSDGATVAFISGSGYISGTTVLATALSGSLTKLGDGTSYLIAGSNVTITTGSNGAVTIAGTVSQSSGTFNDVASKLSTTGTLAVAGNLGANYFANNVGNDVNFFVSGSSNSKGTATRGTTVLGGDVVVSGTLFGGVSFGNTYLGLSANRITLAGGTLPLSVFTNDSNLYFSGSARSKGSSTAGTAVFGGDLLASGVAYFPLGLSGSLTNLADGTSYLIAGTGTTITTGSTGAVTVGINNSVVATVSGTAFTGAVYTQNLFVSGNTVMAGNLTVNGSVTSVSSSNLNIADPIIYIASGSVGVDTKSAIAFASGSSTANQSLIFGVAGSGNVLAAAKQDVQSGTISQSSLNFSDLVPLRASSYQIGGSAAALTSSDGQGVILYSGGGSYIGLSPGSLGLSLGSSTGPVGVTGSNVRFGNISAEFGNQIPSQPGLDSYFFVSGSKGSKGTSVRGTAVFGGDLQVSGASYFAQGLSGSLTKLADGTNYLIAGNNVSISTGSSGAVTIASALESYWQSTISGIAFATGSAYAAFISSSNGLEVTGSVKLRGTLNQGNTVNNTVSNLSVAFGNSTTATGYYSLAQGVGSSVTNDSAHAEGYSTTASGYGSHAEGYGTFSTNDYSHAEGDATTASGRFSHAEGSGSLASGKYSHAGGFKTTASGEGQVVFGKYNVASNSASLFVIGDGTGSTLALQSDILRVNSGLVGGTGRVEVTGTLAATAGISGSLTQLTDGTSYLIAGANVTITTGSNGAVTIASTGGGGGSGTGFNDGGSKLNTTSSVAFAGGLGSSYYANSVGTDVFLFVSGASGIPFGGPAPAPSNMTLFNGDIAVSGALRGKTNLLVPNSLVAVSDVTIFSNPAFSNINYVGQPDIFTIFGGTAGSKDTTTKGVSVFQGDVMMSGSTYVASGQSIFPVADRSSDLGSPSKRWGNVYTGDLHLRNDRGDWTIVEEEDYLCVVNNKTGKKFKMALIPLEE